MSSEGPPAGPMRRLVFSNYDSVGNPYYGGGGARAIHEIARRLTGLYNVRVVTGQFPGNRARIVDGVAYEPIGLRRAGPYLGQMLYQFCLPWRAARGDYDLWVESLTPPFSTACLPWFTRKPVAALTQVLAGAGMTRKYGLPFATIERLGLRAYRHAIVLSTHLRTVVTRANPRLRTVVIPNGVSPDLIDLPVRRDERHLLFLGRIDIEQKGLDLWIEALAAIAPRLAPPVLIAGTGPARQEQQLRRRIASLGLEDKVRLLGKVGDQAKSELLRQSFLMVMPSRHEASPLVLIEAFCHAVPVVMFDIPDLGDIPGDCCVKVPAFDTRAFGEAVLDLITDEARRSALGRVAKAFARRFSWDDLAPQYAAFFEEMFSDTAL
ncbi:MAG: glycosyltransferase family 4 protein [Verrucomicrobia bacterium]|nr:glycosyltransferase family 4 protein [Verrucomicrobiota bacterium]HOG85655.1 glycosyltransferase family 4 protein [Verrucomicrobiota bacterium]HPV09134.1 glycosyltransferase family 4 protein [Verrucomicrobiota bacterium]HQJ98879.1 glycosyltransferase family 4 protein [Verrucomicrobiota bacterium]